MAEIPIPLVGPSNEGIHPKADCQRTINLYPVKIEREGEKSRWHLVGTPGTVEFADVTNLVRGKYVYDARLFVVSGNALLELYSDGTTANWGTIGSIRGKVTIAELNGTLVIGDGSGFYSTDLSSTTISVITDAPTGRHCESFKGRIHYLEDGSGRVFYSDLNDATTIDPLNFYTAENKPDDVLTIRATEDQIWLFGTDTIEPWYASGDATDPFLPVPGGVIHAGVLAADTVVRVDNSFFWVEKDAHGQGIVRRSQGFTPLRVSTSAVERFTDSATNLTAYSYQEQGHTHVMLNADEGTWGFDLKENEWHERAWLNQATGELERQRAEIHAFAFGKHLVSDYETGQIFEQSMSYYSDDGTPLVARRLSASTDADGRSITMDEFEMSMATGVGLSTGQGSAPLAMLRYSTDGGQTFSSELHREIGAIGKTQSRVCWTRLGVGRDWAFEVSISDPIPRVIAGAWARATVGGR